jgi:hypothetical protein
MFLPDLSPGLARAFEDENRDTVGSKRDGRCKSSDAGTNDDDGKGR